MRFLLTGVTGFIGSEVLCRLLLEAPEAEIFCLTRSWPPQPESLLALRAREHELSLTELEKRVHPLRADLQDPSGLAKVLPLERFDAVLHLAAQISATDPAAEARQAQVNVESTRVLFEWAAGAGCARFVFMSSVVAFGASQSPRVRSEKDFPHFEKLCQGFGYYRSKRQAHEALVEQARRHPHTKLTLLCPSVVHGSLENFKNSRPHLKMLLAGRLKWIPSGGGNFVNLDRVAQATVEAALGEREGLQLLVDRNLDFCSYLKLYAARALPDPKTRPRLRRLPRFLCRTYAATLSLLAKLHLLPRLNRPLQALLQTSLYLYFESEKPQPPTEGLEAALDAALRPLPLKPTPNASTLNPRKL